jgi:hypothetical protein
MLIGGEKWWSDLSACLFYFPQNTRTDTKNITTSIGMYIEEYYKVALIWHLI